MEFLKIKNKFVCKDNIKSFAVECAKEWVTNYKYPNGYLSDYFLILTYNNDEKEEFHFYTHYNTPSERDEDDEFRLTMIELVGEEKYEHLMDYLRKTRDCRDGDDYVREEDKYNPYNF